MGFKDRLNQEGQRVYDRIVAGEVTDVDAELMGAHYRASAVPDTQDKEAE
nr:hypothetical protein OG690_38595 [Streptomyces tubercidicus]